MNCNNNYCPGVHDFYIRPKDAAKHLGISYDKLEDMRIKRSGPTCIQYAGGATMYSGKSVMDFAEKEREKRATKVEKLDIL